MKIKFYKVLILVLFILVFLISYEFIKGNFKLNFLNKKTNLQDIFYCDDDSYTLTGTTCTKYIVMQAELLGDLDSSGMIDLTDINILKDYLDSKKTLSTLQLKLADVNFDDVVDVNDLSSIQNSLNNSDANIGKKYMCDTNYELKNNLCIQKNIKEANETKTKKVDLNQNGKFDNDDLSKLKNYLNGKEYFTNVMLKIADYNSDDKIDIKDLKYLKSKKLKDIKVSNSKDIYVDKINIDDDLKIDVYKNSKKSTIDTNTTIKYYFNTKLNKDFYYEWVSISDDKVYEKSMCTKLNNNTKYIFDIKVKGNKNYYVMNIYEDYNCDKLVKEFKTEEYKMKSV